MKDLQRIFAYLGPYRKDLALGAFLVVVESSFEMVIPVLMAGRMDNPEMASESIDNGTCDVISLGRPLLADPDYVKKLRAGRLAEIRPCISCQEGCMGRIQEYSMINCAVNP